jgi:hypothetical protein
LADTFHRNILLPSSGLKPEKLVLIYKEISRQEVIESQEKVKEEAPDIGQCKTWLRKWRL